MTAPQAGICCPLSKNAIEPDGAANPFVGEGETSATYVVRWPTRVLAGVESATELDARVTRRLVLADAPAAVDPGPGTKVAVSLTGDEAAENDARQVATVSVGVIGSRP